MMKAIHKSLVAVAMSALLLGALSQAARAGEKTPPSPEALLKALAEAGKPGAEHQKLQPLVGQWTFTMKVWTDPTQPAAELKGTTERKWILDGRFVQEIGRCECAKSGKSFETVGLLGYDAAQKKFSFAKACGLCGVLKSGEVTCNSAGTRFECVRDECCLLTAQKIKSRDEVLIENNDRIVFNHYKTIGDRELKVIEIVSIRQK